MKNYNVKEFRNKMKSKLLSRNIVSNLQYGSQNCINLYTCLQIWEHLYFASIGHKMFENIFEIDKKENGTFLLL